MRSCSGCYYAFIGKESGLISCMKIRDVVLPESGIDCPYYRDRRTDSERVREL
jgi:hypothetical protein